MTFAISLVLAVACAVLSVAAFLSDQAVRAAVQGVPGAIGVLFFLVLARASRVRGDVVKSLATWLLPAGGACIVLGVACAASTLFTLVVSAAALPLCIVGCPLVAVACLRLSTRVERPMSFRAAAVAHLVMAVIAVAQFVQVMAVLRFG